MILISEVGASGTRRSGATNNQLAHRRNQALPGWHLAGTEGPRAGMKEPRGQETNRGAKGANNQYAGNLARGWLGREVLGKGWQGGRGPGPMAGQGTQP